MEILTREAFRGRGYAPVLLQYAVREMKQNRFKSLYAWIWHSNIASVRAFEKAGWRYIAFVTEVLPFNAGKILRFQWNKP
jgi:L-amino acid N-acyltransferase YncA